MNRQRLIRLIHVGKRNLSLSDDAYRSLIEGAVGRYSCSDCSLFELDQILSAMKKLGFKPTEMPVRQIDRGRSCTEAQRRYIKGLWELVARSKTDASLNAFIKRIAGVDHLRFLGKPEASKVILALRDITRKAGFNPDRKES